MAQMLNTGGINRASNSIQHLLINWWCWWILSRFYSTLEKVGKDLENFKFNEAANSLYSFFWHEFCDWYLELIKPQISQKQTQVVMYKVLEKTLRILHPFMPFISEEIWQRLPGAHGSIMQQSWPHLQVDLISRKDELQMEQVFEVINTIRNMRAELEINPASRIDIRLAVTNKVTKKLFEQLSDYIKNLAKVGNLIITDEYLAQNNQYAVVLKDLHVIMPLEGVLDIAQQLKKTDSKIERLNAEIKNKEGMLANSNFTARAPAEIVEAEKIKLTELKEQVKKLEAIKNGLR
jgi:valyl-tRNA synthetase